MNTQTQERTKTHKNKGKALRISDNGFFLTHWRKVIWLDELIMNGVISGALIGGKSPAHLHIHLWCTCKPYVPIIHTQTGHYKLSATIVKWSVLFWELLSDEQRLIGRGTDFSDFKVSFWTFQDIFRQQTVNSSSSARCRAHF